MHTVGAFEAKTHLSSLLDRVAKGEKITITRHGIPAAVLVAATENATKLSHSEVVGRMRELRQRVKPGTMSIKKMIEEGRRY
jgi:prevent-host-death family protein